MKQRLTAFVLVLLIAFSSVITVAAQRDNATELPTTNEDVVADVNVGDYEMYRALNGDQPITTDTVTVLLSTGVAADPTAVEVQ